MNFKNILNLPFHELLSPGVMAARDVSSGKMQLLASNSLVTLLIRTITAFNEGSFNNLELQKSFNLNQVELLLISKFELPDDIPENTMPLVIRLRTKEQRGILEANGLALYSVPNEPKITAKVIIKRGFYPQVILRSANYSKLYVQKLFKTVPEAEDYIKSTDLIQMILDTKGSAKLYKPAAELPLASSQAVESNEVTQTLIENEEENTDVL